MKIYGIAYGGEFCDEAVEFGIGFYKDKEKAIQKCLELNRDLDTDGGCYDDNWGEDGYYNYNLPPKQNEEEIKNMGVIFDQYGNIVNIDFYENLIKQHFHKADTREFIELTMNYEYPPINTYIIRETKLVD